MSVYAFKGAGPALPYDSMFAVLKRHIDIPALVAVDYGKLALASAPTVSLTSFSGFVENDILEIWEVPAGTIIVGAGCRVTTEEGATAAADLGFTSATQTQLGVDGSAGDPNAYGTFNLNDAESICVPLVALDGTAEMFGDLYVTDGSIDLEFTTNDTYAAAIFDLWAIVARAFEPSDAQ
jgi:hypothetical protein